MRRSAALAFAVLVGCGSVDCTAIGCSGNGVEIRLPEIPTGDGYSARVCVEGVCKDERFDVPVGSTARARGPLPADAQEVGVTLRVTDASGQVLIDAAGRGTVRVVYPNGRECGDECRSLAMIVEGKRLLS